MNDRHTDCYSCPRVRALEAKVERLERRVEELLGALEASRRAGKRQAAPFSKGPPRSDPRRPGRRSGADYGRRHSRPAPRRIDETLDAPLPPRCPNCGRAHIDEQAVHDQFQTDVPKVEPFTRRFRVHVGTCAGCGRRVQGRHELQTSDALGAAAVQIGPNALALAAQMNKELGVAYGKIVVFFRTAFGMRLSRATPCRANERLARKAGPTYRAMVVAVRGALVAYADETGWKIGGDLAWLWIFTTVLITVYVIRRSRGSDVVREILGDDFPGTLGRDGWLGYRPFVHWRHQTCTTHLLRRCRDLHETARAGEARFPLAVKRTLQAGLALRDRRDEMSPHGFAVARGRIVARMDRLLAGRLTHEPNAVFARHLARERDALFTYLRRPEVEASAWMAEQGIRPAVVNRKTSGGSRTDLGADAQGILTSVIRTARQQRREPVELMIRLQRAPHPVDLGLARGPRGRPRIVRIPCYQARASPAA